MESLSGEGWYGEKTIRVQSVNREREGRVMTATERPSWRKTCSMCGAYYAPYCYGIELMPGSDRELEHPYKTKPNDWCAIWRRERKTEWNGKPCDPC